MNAYMLTVERGCVMLANKRGAIRAAKAYARSFSAKCTIHSRPIAQRGELSGWDYPTFMMNAVLVFTALPPKGV